MNLQPLLARHHAQVAYVVSKGVETLRGPDAELRTGPGMFHHVLDLGARHPLAKALGPADSLVDATLGLAKDALHAAELTGATVVGLERSPALAVLAEAGLRRLAQEGARWSPAAARIRVVEADAAEWLSAHPDTADVVYLDPMFDAPLQAAPGFALLRHLAAPTGLEALLGPALCAARRRVVIRLPREASLPDGAQRVRGQAVDYAVLSRL